MPATNAAPASALPIAIGTVLAALEDVTGATCGAATGAGTAAGVLLGLTDALSVFVADTLTATGAAAVVAVADSLAP